MRELAQLNARMLRPTQNVNQDGGFELGWGLALLCFGLSPYLNALFTKSPWFSSWTAWIGFLPLLCAAFAPYAVPKAIKRLVTWPRTGYVVQEGELKFSQLLLLLVFGGALGQCLGLAMILATEGLEMLRNAGAHGDWRHLAPKGIQLLILAPLTVYLGRKVIRKRPPAPTAYDAAAITQGLSQSPAGRSRLHVVKLVVWGLLLGVPILVFGVVFGLAHWSQPLTDEPGIRWSAWAVPGFLVAANAVLYLMASCVALKPHRWKWWLLPAMVAAPLLLAPAIPRPARITEFDASLAPLPPVMLCLGLVWFLSGTIGLVLFLRQHPLPAERP